MSQFIFQSRAFADILLPDLTYRVKRYSKAAIGGPLEAEVEATGTREGLFELVEHLRAPVEIFNEIHDPRWWGLIQEVRIEWHGIEFGVSLDTMVNKVAVAYTENHFRQTTPWSTDATSSGEYGTKEDLLSISEITAADALQKRDTWLARRKYPIPVINSNPGGKTERATIYCRGWIDTLDWRHYANASGLEAYETLGTGSPGREIGEDDRPIFAQAFQLSSASGWSANAVWIRLWKEGAPADNFTLTLRSDSAGDPGAVLATASIAGADVPESATWVEFALSVDVALSTGTTYWIHCARSGGINTTNYYIVGVNQDLGYLNGDAKLYNTGSATWTDASHKGDLNFRVLGDTETTAQITALVSSVGEFFTGSEIEDASGIATNAYRVGDRRALYELLRLLKTGTTNDRRLLAEVTRGRVLRVYEEPAPPTSPDNAYSLSGTGKLYSSNGRAVRPSDCIVAQWCGLGDVIPGTVDLSRVADPSLFFIEEAEYDVDQDEYRILRSRDAKDVFEIGGVA